MNQIIALNWQPYNYLIKTVRETTEAYICDYIIINIENM